MEVRVNFMSIEEAMTTMAPQKTLKPFVKWAGGKGQLADEIKENFPTGLGSTITKYAEPFVGGGAILFEILSNYSLKEIYISDINRELINTYLIIRDSSTALIEQLYSLQNQYIPLDTDKRKIYYYEKRERFNDLKINVDENFNIEKAALFIFLNKTCFNGLYRVNRKGLFNVPMGAYKNPRICDSGNLLNISRALQNVEIVHADFRESHSFIDNNTFVYFDPPYRPLNQTSNFTSYAENSFDDQAQIELAKFTTQIDTIGALFLLSNSDPKNTDKTDNFFDELYEQYKIKRVHASRMINCMGKSRGKISELLISNY